MQTTLEPRRKGKASPPEMAVTISDQGRKALKALAEWQRQRSLAGAKFALASQQRLIEICEETGAPYCGTAKSARKSRAALRREIRQLEATKD